MNVRRVLTDRVRSGSSLQLARRRFEAGGATLIVIALYWMGQPVLSARTVPDGALPAPDFHHFAAYLSQLQESNDPSARAILRAIARGPQDLAQERAAARHEGLPLAPEQLQQPLPPATQNAATYYRKLERLLRDRPMKQTPNADAMGTEGSYSLAQIAAVEAIFRDRRDVMNLIYRAANCQLCVFDHPTGLTSDALEQTLPDFEVLREVERLLKTESYLLDRSGHHAEAIQDEARGLRVAQQAASDPTVIAYLVLPACESIILEGFKESRVIDRRDSRMLRLLRKALLENRPLPLLRHNLRGELPLWLYYWQYARREGPDALAHALANGGDSYSGQPWQQRLSKADRQAFQHLMDAQAANLIHRLRKIIAAAGEPPPARRTAFRLLAAPHSGNPITAFADVALSSEGKIAMIEDRRRAREDAVLAAITLELNSDTPSIPRQSTRHGHAGQNRR